MAEEFLLKAGTVEITPKVARFGDTSYQVANIGSVSVHSKRSMNGFSIMMIIIGICAGFWGVTLHGTDPDRGLYVLIGAVVCEIAAMVIQKKWPEMSYTVILKTSSGDIQALTSNDLKHVYAVQRALESAFSLR